MKPLGKVIAFSGGSCELFLDDKGRYVAVHTNGETLQRPILAGLLLAVSAYWSDNGEDL
jgi:hypothetical protein